jgi:muramidase (phage lysozyme)/uncharacterized protein (DUF2345 family)
MAGESRRTNRERNTRENAIGPGPYEAVVVSNLDSHYMGTLKVDILRSTSSGSIPNKLGTSISVRYLSPFYGVTNLNHNTPNDGYSSTQKSYGMWFVPPDPGSRVLVIFAEGDISQGFWIGCIQDKHMNFMIPDGRASTFNTTRATPDNIQGAKLPVGEYNKLIERGEGRDPTKFNKPYNKDFTQVLEVQGLLRDEHRGTTTTSARREVPSMVFGISTPGPLDKRPGAPRGLAAGEGTESVFVSRLGGSSFVMDDGDNSLLRKTHASEGPPDYVNVEVGEQGGDRTLLHNELMRFRTRTGHQILMHNTEDFIYIGNARGTAWVELSSDGKIDVYGKDSISIHSDGDINLTADRDVNIEGGRNINMRASARATNGQDADGTSGNINIESKYNTEILVEQNMKTQVYGFQETKVDGYQKTLVAGAIHHHSNSDIFIRADGEGHLKAVASMYISTDDELHTVGTTAQYMHTTGGPIHVNASGGNVEIDGDSNINLNSGTSGVGLPAIDPEDASSVTPLHTHSNPKVTPGTEVASDISSIVKRMPSHEPWPHHENLDPMRFKLEQTDVLNLNRIDNGIYLNTPDTFRKDLNTGRFTGSGTSSGANITAQSGTRPVTSTTSNPNAGFPPANYSAVGAYGNLLDVIGNAESSGYNTVYSGSRIAPYKPITTMTVEEVLQWQSDSVSAGSASSAAGRYQYIRQTLNGLVNDGVLARTDIFNPANQDKLARESLRRRGLNNFINGTKSLEAMAKSIAQEWASMPVIARTQGQRRIVNAGESYYAGDGLNKSLISTTELVAALNSAKEQGTV